MKAEIIKKYCKTCYWHKYHGCHIDICGPNKCANAVALEALEEVNKKLSSALALDDMLRRLEWSNGDSCPVCKQYRPSSNAHIAGHAPDCELGNMLKESEGEEG